MYIYIYITTLYVYNVLLYVLYNILYNVLLHFMYITSLYYIVDNRLLVCTTIHTSNYFEGNKFDLKLD